MEPRLLTSAQNPVAQRFRRASVGRKARREGSFLLEGRHLLEEALAMAWPMEILLVAPDLWPKISKSLAGARDIGAVYLATRELLERLGTVPAPEGTLALCPRKPSPLTPVRRGDLFLYLDRVQDPANVGILVRSAAAFGLRGVLCGPGTADPFSPTALSRSAGAALRLNPSPCEEATFLAWVEAEGVDLYGADAAGIPLDAFPKPGSSKVLVVGNEGGGLSASLREACRDLLSVRMEAGWDSLNVAAAGSILMYLLAGRRLGEEGSPGDA